MVCGVFQQIKSIHHSSFLYENSDFPTFFPATFNSRVCHQGAYRFGSPVLAFLIRNESLCSSNYILKRRFNKMMGFSLIIRTDFCLFFVQIPFQYSGAYTLNLSPQLQTPHSGY